LLSQPVKNNILVSIQHSNAMPEKPGRLIYSDFKLFIHKKIIKEIVSCISNTLWGHIQIQARKFYQEPIRNKHDSTISATKKPEIPRDDCLCCNDRYGSFSFLHNPKRIPIFQTIRPPVPTATLWLPSMRPEATVRIGKLHTATTAMCRIPVLPQNIILRQKMDCGMPPFLPSGMNPR